MQELKQGTPLQGGKYIIKRVLGQGGFGITYLAEQVSLGREVAIKEFFMKDSCTRNQASGTVTMINKGCSVNAHKYYEKFKKEATILASLDHPNIVNVIELFDENGTTYYVMPYLTGGSLKTHRIISEKQALCYINQVAKALKYMHEKSLCHYDVKPANILLDAHDNAILIDFGISKNYDHEGNETTTTPVGMSAGFTPIEQYDGKASTFSPESDVYALGATLYYLLMGKIPPSVISQEDLYFTLHGITKDTRYLILNSMNPDHKKRPKDVDAFIDAKPTPQAPELTPIPKRARKRIHLWPSTHIIKKIIRIALLIVTLLTMLCGSLFWVNHNKGLNLPYDPLERLEEDMVYIEGGTFIMGATSEQVDEADDDERPAHKEDVSGFYICKHEVTQGLWKAIMGENPSKHQGTMLNLFKGDLERPVECVSWEDCQEFIVKLSELTGNHYRLLTETEWEYAARGGNHNKGLRYSGSNYIYEVAWYRLNSGKATHTVGTKRPNELGLFDMSGNVNEWCQDIIDKDYKNRHIIRGGTCNDEAKYCRVSQRGYNEESSDQCGLRLAADVPFKNNYHQKTNPSWWQKKSPQWLSAFINWIFNS